MYHFVLHPRWSFLLCSSSYDNHTSYFGTMRLSQSVIGSVITDAWEMMGILTIVMMY